MTSSGWRTTLQVLAGRASPLEPSRHGGALRPKGRPDLLLHPSGRADPTTLSLQELLNASRLIYPCRVPIDVEPTQLEYFAIFRPEWPATV